MLPVAIILMLIGTPITDLITMGPKALAAMAVATGTIFFSQIAAYLALMEYLPEDAWKSVGALMGTWIGGSVNMVAIKEILQLPDSNLSALVIVDAIMSYAWMAILLFSASLQNKFDVEKPAPPPLPKAGDDGEARPSGDNTGKVSIAGGILVLTVGFVAAEICVWLGRMAGEKSGLIPINGWILVLASTAAVLMALTPLRRIKKWGTQKIGTLALYVVLVTIGAKTTIGGAQLQAPIYLVYGVLAFGLHGTLMLAIGRISRLPLFLLSTASQANIGGAVSAPVVAEAYRSGTAHIGVLMAVLGAVLGTYLGVAGGYFCRALGEWLG